MKRLLIFTAALFSLGIALPILTRPAAPEYLVFTGGEPVPGGWALPLSPSGLCYLTSPPVCIP